jgi:hypothetical protein
MMPTFPRSPLSFRTAGFPQYGWKAAFQAVPSWMIGGLSLLPACAVRHPVCIRPSCASWSQRLSRSVSGVGSPTRLRTAVEGHCSSAPGALAQARVIVSRTVITYSAPSVPLAGTSQPCGRFPSSDFQLCPLSRHQQLSGRAIQPGSIELPDG